MKKLLALIILCSFVFPIFADDAKVMPAGVIRGTFVFTNNTASESFDEDGEAQDLTYGDLSAMNLGTALEMGVTDQVTAAVQWAPGYNMTGEFADNDKIDLTGLYDLFVGAKVQVMGNQGYVKDDNIRLAIAPGVKIPLNGYDAEAEAEKAVAGDDFKLSVSKDTLGMGLRAYADYEIIPGFFVNLYSEYIYYLPVEKVDVFSYIGYYQTVGALMGGGTSAADAAAAATAAGLTTEEVEFNYGYDLTLEVEPQYSYSLGEVGSVSLGLPITYKMAPEIEKDGEAEEDSAMNSLQLKPWVSFFTTKTGAPMSFKVAYYTTVMGENTTYNVNTLLLQARVYLKAF